MSGVGVPPQRDAPGPQSMLIGEQLRLWKSGERALLVFDKVAFNDVFGKRLVVRACIRCEYRNDTHIEATVYPHHNEQQNFVEA